MDARDHGFLGHWKFGFAGTGIPARNVVRQGRPRRVDHLLLGRPRSEPLNERLLQLPKAWGEWGTLIRAVGGRLPVWVEPSIERDPSVFLDLIILRDPTWLSGFDCNMPRRVEGLQSYIRVIVGDTNFAKLSLADWQALPRADLVVSAEERDIDTVAACFVHLVSSENMICFDWSDALSISGLTSLKAAQGVAVVVPGQGADTGKAVRRVLQSLSDRGFAGGAYISQFVSIADTRAFTLLDVDVMATETNGEDGRPILLTCFLDSRRTEVVVIAFST